MNRAPDLLATPHFPPAPGHPRFSPISVALLVLKCFEKQSHIAGGLLCPVPLRAPPVASLSTVQPVSQCAVPFDGCIIFHRMERLPLSVCSSSVAARGPWGPPGLGVILRGLGEGQQTQQW